MKKEAVFLSELISKMKRKCNLVELCMRDYLPVAVHLTYFVLRFWIFATPIPANSENWSVYQSQLTL